MYICMQTPTTAGFGKFKSQLCVYCAQNTNYAHKIPHYAHDEYRNVLAYNTQCSLEIIIDNIYTLDEYSLVCNSMNNYGIANMQ